MEFRRSRCPLLLPLSPWSAPSGLRISLLRRPAMLPSMLDDDPVKATWEGRVSLESPEFSNQCFPNRPLMALLSGFDGDVLVGDCDWFVPASLLRSGTKVGLDVVPPTLTGIPFLAAWPAVAPKI